MLNELAAAVRNGTVHPRELVAESLRRIEAADPALNCVTELRAEEALAEAEASPRTGPLAGIPFLVKDLADVAGMRTTCGTRMLADAPLATTDHLTVARLRAAGAIPVGKTNTPEFAYTAATHNPLWGVTRNPWNLERSPGGSSGGSAAALAAGLTPIATTSDGGGSVRIPASLCGLFGYKPTTGAVPRPAASPWIDYSTWGATGATVADVLAEASIYIGPAFGDPGGLPAGSIDLTPRLPKRALLVPTLRSAIEPGHEDAVRRAAGVLEAAGVEVVEADNPIPGAVVTWFLAAAVELSGYLATRFTDEQRSLMGDDMQAYIAFGRSIGLDTYLDTRRQRFDLTRVLDEALGDDTVLISAVTNVESWVAEGPLPTRIGDHEDPALAVNTPEFNVTSSPAASVPIGHDAVGVPIGLQVIGPRWRDGLVLGTAEALERAQPWAPTAPGYEPFPLP